MGLVINFTHTFKGQTYFVEIEFFEDEIKRFYVEDDETNEITDQFNENSVYEIYEDYCDAHCEDHLEV